MVNWYEEEDFVRNVFFVNYDKEIVEECTLGELAKEYADETTTPHGVAPRYHTRGKELWSWGAGGNNPYKVEEFDTEEEAEHALMLSFRYDLDNGLDRPIYYSTREEAEADLEEYLGLNPLKIGSRCNKQCS